MSTPTIKTTVVGSYPVPAWLAAYPTQTNLVDAIMVIFQTQELAGIDVVADGELYRFDVNHPETNGMIDYFIQPMSGVETRLTHDELATFRMQAGMQYRTQPAGVVRDGVGPGSLNLPADFRMVRGLTDRPIKFTCTGPHMLAKVLMDTHYGDLPSLTMALAEVLRTQLEEIDADIIQIDEANISGHPQEHTWAAEAINHVLAGIQCEKAVHICFGNYGGQTVQKGFWQDLLPFMNALQVDHLVLEFARRGYDELAHFQELRPEIGLGLGVVDIKDNEIESPDLITSRIEQAVATLGEERIRYVHPDCGFWMLQRSVADRKIAVLVEGRNQFLGI